MNSRINYFCFLIFLGLLSVLAFPLYQSYQTGGLVFYVNGIDESSYLQYDYALLVAKLSGLSRLSEWVVVGLHELGLSGGWINFLLDFLAITTLPVLIYLALRQSKEKFNRPLLICLLILIGTTVWGSTNPIIEALRAYHLEHNWIYWLTMPNIDSNPFLRSPEPQISLTLLAIAFVAAQRLGSHLPLLAICPFLYPFVGIPVAFIVLADLIYDRFQHRGLALSFSYLVISVALLVAKSFVRAEVQEYFSLSHLPLVSLMGTASLSIYLLTRDRFAPLLRFRLLTACLSCFAVSNTQVISGWLIQPYNYEQYWGVVVTSFLIALVVSSLKKIRYFFIAGLLGLFGILLINQFNSNLQLLHDISKPDEIYAALSKDSGLVAIPDIRLATWLNLLYPKQAPTFFAATRTYQGLAEQNFKNYLCAKAAMRSSPSDYDSFKSVFEFLDSSYRNNNKDYIQNTIGRRTFLGSERDIDSIPTDCPKAELKIFKTRP